MAVKMVELMLPFENSESVPDRLPILDTPENYRCIQVFFDDSWAPGKRDMVIYLSGGDGAEIIKYPPDERPDFVVGQGFLFIKWKAYTHNPYQYLRSNHVPIRYQNWQCMELEFMLEKIFTSVKDLPSLKGYITSKSNVGMCGHSRGAAISLQYSSYVKTQMTKYLENIKILVPSSPAGGGSPEWSGGPTLTSRAIYSMLQHSMIKTICLIGRGDSTHSTRAMMERVEYMINNPLVEIRYVGDDTYGHSWSAASIGDRFKPLYQTAIDELRKWQ